jgi:hypothetical protein
VFLLVIGAVIVAVVAFLLRQAGGGNVDAADAGKDAVSGDDDGLGAARAEASVSDGHGGDDEDDDEDAAPGFIAVSSDDLAFVPRRHAVLVTPAHEVRKELERQRRRAAGETELPPPAFPENPHGEQRANILLQQGDLIATRVLRGAPDIDPWRLETLGRDRDLSEWAFETEEAARAAQEMLERVVVRPTFDDDGELLHVGDEDFWVAEQERMRTLAEFETPDEPEEEPRR